MKKIFIILALVIFSTTQAFAFENTLPVKKVIFDLGRYTNAHKIEKLKTLYTQDFKSGDGFEYDVFFKMVEETFESYDDIKVKTKIKDVVIEGDKATVTLTDKTSAKLLSTQGSMASYGDLDGICNYIIYMKKEDGKWKIASDKILSENTSLKYGDAKSVKMDVSAPENVKEDSEYSIILKMGEVKDAFVIASLSRENITYPPGKTEEVFRKLSPEGELERVVRSNKSGLNEYAVASVGFTRVQMDESFSSIQFQMSGVAFLTSRVNIEKGEVK